jgi:hypothetical protein
MTRRVGAALCAVGALLVTLLYSVPPHLAVRARTMPFPGIAVDGGQDTPLPAGFAATVDRATSDRFVRVVAGDVDRDGDIDVVASLGSLDLIVWTNDGAGHFTRLASSSHTALQNQPLAPTVDGDSLASNEWIQNDLPRAEVESLRACVIDDPTSPFTALVRLATGQNGGRVRSSRAPPLPRAL